MKITLLVAVLAEAISRIIIFLTLPSNLIDRILYDGGRWHLAAAAFRLLAIVSALLFVIQVIIRFVP
jgi:hypothetical protein